MLKRKQQIIPSCKDFELRAGSRICIGKELERLAVHGTTPIGLVVVGRRGEFTPFKQVLALALRVQSAAIDQHADLALRPSLGEYLELLVGAFVLSREAEQFKKKSAAAHVGRIVPQFCA